MRQGGYVYERARFPQGARSRPRLFLTAACASQTRLRATLLWIA